MKKLFAALSVAVSLVACGPNVVRDAARATTIAGNVLSATREQLIQIRRAELDACTDTECLNRIEENWRAPALAFESARVAHRLLVDALVVASIAEQDGISVEALRTALDALANACDDLIAALDLAGVNLPSELLQAARLVTGVLRTL